ncbi:MAG: thioredoxin family protein, partial [Mucispirillum sp.]|nr:thioredoxin family protein [Mucispirillum sp.]
MKKNITGILIILLIVAAVFAVKKCGSSENISSDLLSFDLNVTEMVDFNKLTSQGLPVIVDYGADTCIPCVNMAPVLEKLNKEMAGRVYIKFADVWKYPDINKNIYAKVIPYQVFF